MAQTQHAYAASARNVRAKVAVADLNDSPYRRGPAFELYETESRSAGSRVLAAFCLLTMILIWPLCAAVWLIEWTFVRFMTRSPKAAPTSTTQ